MESATQNDTYDVRSETQVDLKMSVCLYVGTLTEEVLDRFR